MSSPKTVGQSFVEGEGEEGGRDGDYVRACVSKYVPKDGVDCLETRFFVHGFHEENK